MGLAFGRLIAFEYALVHISSNNVPAGRRRGVKPFMRHVAKAALLAAVVVLFPVLASAQSLTGVVRDASGGVLPGVTVEAASPALIEKVRTVVSDGSGQYRLENLPPGTYSVTYTLPGFSTVRRDAVQVTSGVTLTLNADMRVGGLQETITVTGETPVVDVQNSTRVQQVLSDEVIAALPASRGYGNLLAVASGVQANGIANSGVDPTMVFFTSRGGRSNEGTVQMDGMNVGSAFNGGGVAGYGYDTAGAQEVQLTVAGGLGEADRGGPQFNLVPKTGGNSFSGTYFGNIAGEWSQSNNVDADLKAIGIPDATKIIRQWDTSFSLGGPIVRDKLWFYGTTRLFGTYSDVAGRFGNLNAGDPNRWNYVADPSIKQRSAVSRQIGGGRITNQISPRNKVSAFYDFQKVCEGSSFTKDASQCRTRGDDWIAVGGFGTWSPEATHSRDNSEHIMQFSYTSPVTNRLLIDAAFSQFFSNWGGQTPGGALDQLPFVPVQERSIAGGVPVPNMLYHGFAGLNNNHQTHNVWRGSLSYVTGAHSMKVGYQAAYEVTDIFGNFASHGLQYRFNAGVPDQITQRITPWQQANRTRYDAFYVQDQWTRNRLTLQGALRYEKAWSFFPEGMNGLLADSVYGGPARTLESAKGVTGYHDVAPRMGLAYDVFGNGKTAIKVNLSKYFQSAANDGVYIGTNPAATFQQTTTRTWNDADRDFNPDCDLNSPLANGECQAVDNRNFFGLRDTGSVLSTAARVSPDLLSGWGVRPFDWQFSTSVQQQLLPRVSAEFGYSRRSWGNITLYDNTAVGPSDFDNYTFTVPTDSRLATSGEQLQFPLLKPSAFGRQDFFLTRADDYGDNAFYWHGVELNVNARMSNGLTIQGGFTSGGGVRDLCEVAQQLPELYVQTGAQASVLLNKDLAACRVEEPWLWAWRGLANYTIPKADVQVSAIMRSQPNVAATNDPASNGLSLNAYYFESSANVERQLGRGLAGGAPNVTLDMARQGDVYPDRLNTVDLRISKVLRFGRTRSNIGIDLYNLFNANTGTFVNATTGFNPNYGTDGSTWLRPNTILNPRYVRFNATIDF
jgi:hypothetical protein